MFFALCAVSLSSVVSLGGKRKTRASRDGRTLLARSFASLLMQLRGSIATAVDKCARRRLFVASMRTFVVPSCVGQGFWGGPVRWRVFSDLLWGGTSLFLLVLVLLLFLSLLLVPLVLLVRFSPPHPPPPHRQQLLRVNLGSGVEGQQGGGGDDVVASFLPSSSSLFFSASAAVVSGVNSTFLRRCMWWLLCSDDILAW